MYRKQNMKFILILKCKYLNFLVDFALTNFEDIDIDRLRAFSNGLWHLFFHGILFRIWTILGILKVPKEFPILNQVSANAVEWDISF